MIAHWKAHGQLSIHLNCTFICYILRFHSYEGKCVQLGCFHRRPTSLHSNFTWTGSSSSNHSSRQKTIDAELPDGEDCIPLPSLVLTQYWRVTDGRTKRRMDRQICRSIYSAWKASCVERCKNCIVHCIIDNSVAVVC